ncbi:unnamed protein product [Caenorhabditis brenneri]
MWLNSLQSLFSLLGAIADLNSVHNSGSFNNSLVSAGRRLEEGTSGVLIDLNLFLAPGIPLNNNMEEEVKRDWSDIRKFAPQVNCDQIMAKCLTFLNKLKKSIVTRNPTDIRNHFSDSFHFKGCLGIHYLKERQHSFQKTKSKILDEVVLKLSGIYLGSAVYHWEKETRGPQAGLDSISPEILLNNNMKEEFKPDWNNNSVRH